MSEIDLPTINTPLMDPKERLLKLYGVDLVAAFSSSAMVAPFIAIVDRSIIENLNGKRTLKEGLRYGIKSLISQPLKFATSAQFRLVLGLYFSTYTTANIVDTTCERYDVDFSQSAMYKFISTSVVNLTLCIYKDKVFAKLFSASPSNKALPKISYLLFALRDSLTIAASFNIPSYMANYLQTSKIVSDPRAAKVTSQLVCPAAVQFVSTPIHLCALDLYNRPSATMNMREVLIRKEYFKSALARIGRIGPAFGIGGVGNSFIRDYRKYI